MTTLNNLEKLIQMATIEQMYSLLQKLSPNEIKNDINISPVFSKCSDAFTNSDEISKLKTNSDEISKLKWIVGSLTRENAAALHEIDDLESKFEQLENKTNGVINLLTERISILESSLLDIKQNSENNSKFLCQQIRGQQTLARFGFTGTTIEENKQIEENITLKIEEKVEELVVEEELVEEEELVDEEGLVDEEELVEEKHEELVEKHEELVEKYKEKDNSSEDEVGTEDEEELEEVKNEEELEEVKNEEELEEVKNEEEQEEEEQEEEEQEEEDEEEEVFEIEIDDVTYYATHEENGILYEMTADGDIGNKVGIIKDGEPIFN